VRVVVMMTGNMGDVTTDTSDCVHVSISVVMLCL
jgi:hypothetical protein